MAKAWLANQLWGMVTLWDNKEIGDLGEKAITVVKEQWVWEVAQCACCNQTDNQGIYLTYVPREDSDPAGDMFMDQALCSYCKQACNQHLRQSGPDTLNSTIQSEWRAIMAAANAIGMLRVSIPGWLPGQKW